MTAVAMALLLGGYSVGLYGYFLLRGYDISFKQLFSFKNSAGGTLPMTNWPPGAHNAPKA